MDQLTKGIDYHLRSAEIEAKKGSVLTCKDERQFEFKPIEEIPYGDKTTGEVINDLKKEIAFLKAELDQTKNAIKKLADYIDSQRFL